MSLREVISNDLEAVTDLCYQGMLNGDYDVGTALSLYNLQSLNDIISKISHESDLWIQFNGVNEEKIPFNMAFLTLLGYTIHHEELEVAVSACKLYLRLLSIPGALAYGLFLPSLFQSIIRVISNYKTEISGNENMEINNGKGKKRKIEKIESVNNKVEIEEEEEEQEQELFHKKKGSKKKSLSSVDLIVQLIESICKCMRVVQLNSNRDVRDAFLESMLQLTKGLPSSLSVIYSHAFELCSVLLSSSHGDSTTASNTLFRGLMDHLSMSYGSIKGSAIPQGHRECRKQTLTFILSIIDENNDENINFDNNIKVIKKKKVVSKNKKKEEEEEEEEEDDDDSEDEDRGKKKNKNNNKKKMEKKKAIEKEEDVEEEEEEEMMIEGDDKVKENENQTSFSSASLLLSIFGLCQQLCNRISEKAELRSSAADTVSQIITHMNNNIIINFVSFLQRYASSARVLHRLFAVELSSSFLTLIIEKENDDDAFLSHRADDVVVVLLSVLRGRAADVGATVRSKALTGISDILSHAHAHNHTLLIEELLFANTNISNEFVSKREPLNLLMRRRLKDEKSVVRRAALCGIEAIAKTMTKNVMISNDDVVSVGRMTHDEAVSVRKQAITTLSIFLTTQNDNKKVQSLWLDCVLPLVYDAEASVQTRALDLFIDYLLNPFTAIQKWVSRKSGNETPLSDEIVFACDLYSLLSTEHAKCIQHSILLLSRSGRLETKKVLSSLEAVAAFAVSNPSFHLSKSMQKASWIVLEGFVECKNSEKMSFSIDPDFVIQTWTALSTSEEEDTEVAVKRVLNVLNSVACSVSASDASALAEQLLQILISFSATTDIIHSLIMALFSLCSAKAPDEKTAKSITLSWTSKLFEASHSYLNDVVMNSNRIQNIDDEISEFIVNHLFTIGEIGMLGVEMDCDEKKVGIVDVPSHLITLIQALVAPTLVQVSNNNENGSKTAITIPDNIRAHAFIALGKMCLRDTNLAKSCITTFVKELETTSSAAIRNNILIVIGDLCRRYTGMVDRYVPNLALCLRDDSALVRQNTLMLLTQLLVEDYVKWKGPLLYRFLRVLVDNASDLRSLVEQVILSQFLKKAPTLFTTHFVESVFVFNDYRDHQLCNQYITSNRERELFSLSQSCNTGKRVEIYNFMLKTMNDESKFQVAARLVHDVLGSIVDGLIPLPNHDSNSAGYQLLEDTFAILCSKNIRISKRGGNGNAENDDIDEEIGDKNAALENAKGKLLSKLNHKHVMQNVVPIVIGLKHMLENNRSPLMKSMMAYMKTLFHDYRAELADMLAADQRLAKEVEYDLRKFEELQKANAILAKANEEANAKIRSQNSNGNKSNPSTPYEKKKRPSLGLANGILATPLAAAAVKNNGTPKLACLSAPRLRNTPSSTSSSAASLKSAPVVTSSNKSTPFSNERKRIRTSILTPLPNNCQIICMTSPLTEVTNKREVPPVPKWNVTIPSNGGMEEDNE